MKKTKPTKDLERLISKAGLASRTQAAQWILEGIVKVNGRVCKDPLRRFSEDVKIEVEGRPVMPQVLVYYQVYKPKDVIVSKKDEKGRQTLFEFLKSRADAQLRSTIDQLHAVGRLDYKTTGLILLTNDTTFSSYMTEPSNEVERVYLVSVRGEFTSELHQKVMQGVQLTRGKESDFYQVSALQILKSSGKESLLKVTLKEGKNREIRKLFEFLGHEVTKLKRISYGPYELGEMKPGDWHQVKKLIEY
jgi:23S rRNA pseudouridine2605 synthase